VHLRLTDPRIRLLDLMGRRQTVRRLTPGDTPVYLVAEGLSDDEFVKAIEWE
jgi:hypothetical protein